MDGEEQWGRFTVVDGGGVKFGVGDEGRECTNNFHLKVFNSVEAANNHPF